VTTTDSSAQDLGSAYQPLTGEQLRDPYPFFARARQEQPVFFSADLGAWVVTRYEDVLRVVRDPQTFSSLDTLDAPFEPVPEVFEILMENFRPVVHLVNSDPPDHTRLRAMVAPAFSAPRISRLEPAIRRWADELIDAFADQGETDLVASYGYPLPMRAIMHMFGVPPEDTERCKRWCDDATLFAFVLSTLPPERQIECAHSVVEFQDYVAELADDRAANPRDDLTSDLLQTTHDDFEPLSPAEVASLLPGFLLAGHESTANLIANAVRLLLERPSRWEGLAAAPETATAVVEEALRLEPSFQGMPRTTTRAVELGGVELEAGQRLLVMFGSANRDAQRFPSADEFDTGRPRLPNLSFGRGIHFCIGALLARLEGQIALETLARRLPGLRLADGFVPAYVPTLMMRGLTRLDVCWVGDA
jgi:cytochrome P450